MFTPNLTSGSKAFAGKSSRRKAQSEKDAKSFGELLKGKSKQKEDKRAKNASAKVDKKGKDSLGSGESSYRKLDKAPHKSKSQNKVRMNEQGAPKQKEYLATKPPQGQQPAAKEVTSASSGLGEQKAPENFLAQLQKLSQESALSNKLSANSTNTEVQNLENALQAEGTEKNSKLVEALQQMSPSEQTLEQSDLDLIKNNMQAGASKNSNLPSEKVTSQSAQGKNSNASEADSLQALSSILSQSESSKDFSGDGSADGGSFENILNSGITSRDVRTSVEGQNFSEALSQVQGSSKGEDVENMSSIVRQARTFIKDGGGSMNIELSPEGMGQVHLKVAVEDGKVNVEMLADNQIAKKSLEDNLMEMKVALETQKLTVDNLKVDFTKDYEKDFTQNQNFAEEQQNRDFAQQFMEQFQHEREERTNSLFGGLQSYMKGVQEPDLALRPQGSYTGKNKGRSINLIA